MAVINSFVNVIAGATVLLGGEPFMDKRIGDGGWTVRRLVGIPLLAIGGVGIVVGYIRNKRVRGQRNDAETFNADSVNETIYLLQDHASGMRCLGTESFLRAELLDTYYYTLYDGSDEDFPEDYDSKPIEEIIKEIEGEEGEGEYYELMMFDFPDYGYWFEPYEKDGYIRIDDFSAKLDANRAKLGTQKALMVQSWLKDDKEEDF